jgi:para-nitrobenzyl esterase
MNITRCVVQVVSLGLAMSLALGACNRTGPAPTAADGAPAPNQSSPSTTQSVPSAPVVHTDAGDVRGTTADSVTSFKGIPYAAPPVGKLRWRAPQPVQPWQGVRDAIAFAESCMQVDDVPKSEDCLKLNVWRPASATADKPLPVMFWIYGGGLVHGRTSLYPGDGLAKQGIVVVSPDYRMNRIGFFAHPALTAESPDEPHGNYGYLDQLAALKWVQRNIAAFGGDPKQVTIVGESAGGGSVLSHLNSPMSAGLFRGAILESPCLPCPRNAPMPLTPLADAEKQGIEYARSQGITGTGPDALAKLRALSAETLIEGTGMAGVIDAMNHGKRIIGLPGSIMDGKFTVGIQESLLATGKQAKVPVIIGSNDADLGIGLQATKDDLFKPFGALAAEARKLFDPNSDRPVADVAQDVLADETMTEPARYMADQIAAGGQPAYLYRFAYVAEGLAGKAKGSAHAMEIPYTFAIPAAIMGDKVTERDRAAAALASAYWVAFVKNGDPNGDGRPQWQRHAVGTDGVMVFKNDATAAFMPDPIKARVDVVRAMREGAR